MTERETAGLAESGDTDELRLMAFADGELSPTEEAELEALLARDPTARERVRLYLETAALARAAFQPVLSEPVPPELEARVRTAARTGSVVSLPPRLRRGLGRAALPLAASIALLLGVALGGRLAGPGVDPLELALDRVPSGERGPAGVVPVATYRLADGRICRRFDRTDGDLRLDGLACRDRRDGWHTMALVAVAPSATGTGYVPAGGGSALVDRILAELGPARPLSPEEEADLVARGWRLRETP